MNEEFVEVYGISGYLLRSQDVNTSSRVAMLASLLYHQLNKEMDSVPFDTLYDYALEETGEKLEKSSFKTLISKLEEEFGEEELIQETEEGYCCTEKMLIHVEEATEEFSRLTDRFT